MGRAYAVELSELDATYKWAIRTSVAELAGSVALSAHSPLIAVGSGGSLTSAHFTGLLHGRFTGQPTQALTPYELVTSPHQLTSSSVLLCSAGGSNTDVIIAAKQLLKRAPVHLFAITTRLDSPLQKLLEEAGWPRCYASATPTRKDGFLATNSILASLVLVTRAYEEWAGVSSCLPETLDQLIHPGILRRDFLEHLRHHFDALVDRATLVVLYGAGTKPAAIDVESRFTEAALSAVQLADFRNFAHGRHNWLSRHAATSGILAICEDEDDIARRTVALLPSSIPSWQMSVEPGIRGSLAAVCKSMLLAQVVGAAKGIDPGCPQVPTFGRKLYHLKAMPPLYPGTKEVQERTYLAIERKVRCPITTLEIRGQIGDWIAHYQHFVERLAAARIRGVVMDYDGTLCAPGRRYEGLAAPIAERINTLLEAGVAVAIATGRGGSVRKALLEHITSVKNRSRLFIGYHNGAEIAPLSDHLTPPGQQPLAPELVAIAESLCANNVISRNATVVAKGRQISLRLLSAGDSSVVLHEAMLIFRSHQLSGAELVTSSHSVDIIGSGVRKTNVVEYLARQLGLPEAGADSILCIGDRGRAPGNDAELLSHPLSLSVDEVNEDPFTCWSIAKPGRRFDLACLEYLTRLRPGKAGMRFDVTGVKS